MRGHRHLGVAQSLSREGHPSPRHLGALIWNTLKGVVSFWNLPTYHNLTEVLHRAVSDTTQARAW